MLSSLVLGLAIVEGQSQLTDWPATRAENSSYTETSRYSDVVSFIELLQQRSSEIRLHYIGESENGKRIPLCILSTSPVLSVSDARKQGKLIAYIQANIHAGEIEGKEASLAIMRDLLQGKHKNLMDHFVFLFCPIYNIDGNDKMADGRKNRPSQDGPALVGERASGQGFDLNRDCIKAESHEMRAVLKYVYNAWDPDIIMDLHTTNGTRHGYQMTYSPPLNPNTNSDVMKFTRDEMLPALRREFKKSGLEVFDYGDVMTREGIRGWYTFGETGRYVSNYAGLRNRISVLSEAASFQPYRVRVEATHRLVIAVLNYIDKRHSEVGKLIRKADATMLKGIHGTELGVRFALAKGREDTVKLEKSRPAREIDHTKAPTEYVTERMPVFDRFQATRTATVPFAYLIPVEEIATIELLNRQGIQMRKLTNNWGGTVQEFVVRDLKVAATSFQGHRLVQIEGIFQNSIYSANSGTVIVPTQQPLGNLAFHILEPESLDGAAAWNFLDASLKVGAPFPVRKVLLPTVWVSEILL